MKRNNFEGKVAFVTGAASGIGRATAIAFALEGASVVVADISEQGSHETTRMIKEASGRAVAVRCDVTQTEEVKNCVGQAIETFGRLDFAFNNAGVEQKLALTAELAIEDKIFLIIITRDDTLVDFRNKCKGNILPIISE